MRLASLKPDGFLLAILLAVAAAVIAPSLGASGGVLQVGHLASASVSIVFFLHGATLPLDSLAHGARKLRLHLLVQATTYVVFPAIGALVLVLGRDHAPPGLAIGFFFLCTVSSTISSSVALTAVAGGNVAAALFNATLSGVLGVMLTPLYVSLIADTTGLQMPLSTAIVAVAMKVLLPLLLGQALRRPLAGFLSKHRNSAALIDRGSIVLIVYSAFCDSMGSGVWTRRSAGAVLLVVLGAIALLILILALIRTACRVLAFERADEITALFCGSQKSLANGLPVAKILFGSAPTLGLIVLPLIIYHQLQLGLGAVLVRRYATPRRTP
jgi:solute carrier family 10 (sodium/bile acid cotransporter), member 7